MDQEDQIINKARRVFLSTQGHILGLKHKRRDSKLNFDVPNSLLVALIRKKKKTFDELFQIYHEIQKLNGLQSFIKTYMLGITTEQLIDMCSQFQYKKYNKGQVIQEEGDSSNNILYIILSGSVLLIAHDQDHKQIEDEQLIPYEQLKEQKQQYLCDEYLIQQQHQIDEDKLTQRKLNKKARIGLNLFIRIKILIKRVRKDLQFDQEGNPDLNPNPNPNPNLNPNPNFNPNQTPKGLIRFQSKCITFSEKQKYTETYGNFTKLLIYGQIFGQKSLLYNQKRSATIIVDNDQTELLMLNKDTFVSAINKLNDHLFERQQILFSIFKDMMNFSTSFIVNMMHSFDTEIYQRGNLLFFEGQKAQKLYIILEGELQISKQINSDKKSIDIAQINKGNILGEECLQQIPYEHTCSIKSAQALVISIKTEDMASKFTPDMINIIIEKYNIKCENRKNRELNQKIQIQMQESLKKSNTLQFIDDGEKKNKLQKQHTHESLKQPTDQIYIEEFCIQSFDTSLFQNHFLLKNKHFSQKSSELRTQSREFRKLISGQRTERTESYQSIIYKEKMDVSHKENFKFDFGDNHQLLERNLRKNLKQEPTIVNNKLLYTFESPSKHKNQTLYDHFNGYNESQHNKQNKTYHQQILAQNLIKKQYQIEENKYTISKVGKSKFSPQFSPQIVKKPIEIQQKNHQNCRRKTVRRIINVFQDYGIANKYCETTKNQFENRTVPLLITSLTTTNKQLKKKLDQEQEKIQITNYFKKKRIEFKKFLIKKMQFIDLNYVNKESLEKIF